MNDDRLFFEENIKNVNRLIARLFVIADFMGPLLALGTFTGVFRVPYDFCIFLTVLGIVFTVIQYFACFRFRNSYYAMYQGIVLMVVFVAVAGSNAHVGVAITYGLVSCLSCMYLDRKVTSFATGLSYVAMCISLLVKSNEIYSERVMINNSKVSWLICEILGYTMEFIFVYVASLSLAKQFRTTIRKIHEKNKKIEDMQTSLIQSFAHMVEWSDLYTGAHIKRTSLYVELIANKLVQNGCYTDILTYETIKLYSSAAPLHDIGKINVPNNILNKPGKFTSEEFEIMKTHARIGYEIIKSDLSDLENPAFIKTAEDMAFYHHEHWDGSGYPSGIKENDIPLSARIMAAADVLDALLSERQYKEAYSLDKTMEIFESSRNKHFEGCIVDAVIELRNEIAEIANAE